MRMLTCLLLWTLCCVAEPQLLFHATYDEGTADAAFARGDATATTELEPAFMPGIRGQALVIGGNPKGKQEIVNGIPVVTEAGRNAYYAAEGNFNFAQGSLAFWLKPLDWDASTRGFNVVFQTRAGDQYFQLYNFFSDERFLFIRGPQKAFTSTHYQRRPWQPGQWQHIVATWNEEEIQLYLNGRLVCARQMVLTSPEVTPQKPISVGPGNSWRKAFSGRSLMDEVKIYSEPLPQERIVAIYREHAEAVERDNGLVTIGQHTPTPDGEIGEWEYAFTGTGWSSPTTGLVSQRQGRYHLSYDEQALYLGLELEPSDEAPEAVLLLANDAGLQTLTYRPGVDPELGSAVHQRPDDGWLLEAVVPFADLGLQEPPDGQRWRFNLGIRDQQRVRSVAPVIGSLDDRSNFLELVFQPAAPQVRLAGFFDMEAHISTLDLSARADDPATAVQAVLIRDTTGGYGHRLSQRMLLEDGRAHPYLAPKPPHTPWDLQDFAVQDVIVNLKDGEAATPLFARQFVYQDSLPLKTNFMYVQDRKQLYFSGMARQPGQVELRFLRGDDSLAWTTRQPIPEGARFFSCTFPLDFVELPPADYMVRVYHVSAEGEAIESWWEELQIPSIDSKILQPYTDPEANVVPAPWTPLQVTGDRVSMWGRTYDFGDNFLFSSLVSQGHEIVAAPPLLRLDGEALEHGALTTTLTQVDELQASHAKSTNMGPLEVASEVVTHFDGYCEVALTMSPAAESVEIPTLSLDLPLRAEHATLVRDNLLSPLMGSKAGAVGDYWFQSLVGGPHFWVGDERAGFNWMAEDLSQWHVRDHSRNVELIRDGDAVIVRLNLVETPLTLNQPLTIRFGFAITPTRPVDPKILRGRLGKDWAQWCQAWDYFGTLDYEQVNVDKIRYQSRGFDEIFLYQGDGLASPFTPEWGFWEEEWRALRPGRGYGQWVGNPNIRPVHGYTAGCVSSPTFFNFVQHMRADFYEQAKTPLTPKAINYYFDTGIGTSMCTNSHHGCSPWTGLDGREYGRLQIAEKRQLQLDCYRMIKRTGPNAKSMTHEGWYRAAPAQHFTDIIIGGEGVENMLATSGHYHDLINPEMFRASWLPQIWGVKTAWLNMLVRAAANSPDKLVAFPTDPHAQQTTRHYYGYCVVHDVDWWDSHKETQAVRELVWAAQDVLGWDEQIRFFGYWEPETPVQQVAPGSSRVLASAYSKDGKLLLAVVNDTDDDQRVELALDLEALGVPAGLTGSDIFAPDEHWTLAPSWEGTVPARDVVLIPFQPKD